MTGQFHSAAVQDLQEVVRANLSAWALPPWSAVSLLNISENATFRVDPPEGAPLVLRVHRLGYHEPAEIWSEIAWIEALRQAGAVDTPAPLTGRDGAAVQRLVSPDGGPDRCAVAFAFVPGREPMADADLPGWFGRLGAVTARLHCHSQGWRPPAGFRRKIWDWDAMFGAERFWGDWRAGVGLDAAGTALLGRAIDLVRCRLERFGRTRARFGLIHADLRLANLLVEGDRLRVIDFDDCGFSWHLYDFAAAVSFFEHLPIVGELRDAWVAGYRGVLPLPDVDVAEMPVFVAMRRFLLVAWIASHPEVPIAQELGAGYTAGALAMAERLLSRFG